MSHQRQLAAILFTDIVGYTALMQQNEQKAVALIKHYNAALNKTVKIHGGKVLNYYGDGSLCIFSSATAAMNCAIDVQKELLSNPIVPLRIGLHVGEVFFEDGKAIGDGVNIASRVQSLGQANTILFSREIYDKVRNHPEFKAVSIGQFDFKNVDEPMEVFALANEGLIVPKREQMSGKLKHDISKKKKSIPKSIIITTTGLILLIAGIFLYTKYFNKQNNTVEKSIAIIPFRNMSNDAQQEYFVEGMMDEILNHLYKIGGLNIISRTSSMAYKESKKTSKEIANELGVGNLLEGSVQKEGDHIRIIVQLINGKTDQHLWAETYDREFKDVFSIQSDIAQQIAAALKLKIDPAVKERMESIPTKNIEAYNLYLQSNPNISFQRNKTILEAAIALDSTFADAYAALGRNWIFSGGYEGEQNSEEVLKNAEPLLQKALQLNPNLAEAHLGLADMYMLYKWDFRSAGSEYQKVVQLNPSNTQITVQLSDFFLAMGKFREALKLSDNAFAKDSSSYYNLVTLALAYSFNNNSREALQRITKAFSLVEKNDWVWTNFIRINVYAGEYKNAILAFEKNKNFFGPNLSSYVLGHAAIAYYKTGQKDFTEKFLNEIKTRSEKSPAGSPSYFMAAIYTAMGRSNEAIQWLQKAYTGHEVEMYWLKAEPLFKPLHGDPRFQNLLGKIGFPD